MLFDCNEGGKKESQQIVLRLAMSSSLRARPARTIYQVHITPTQRCELEWIGREECGALFTCLASTIKTMDTGSLMNADSSDAHNLFSEWSLRLTNTLIRYLARALPSPTPPTSDSGGGREGGRDRGGGGWRALISSVRKRSAAASAAATLFISAPYSAFSLASSSSRGAT